MNSYIFTSIVASWATILVQKEVCMLYPTIKYNQLVNILSGTEQPKILVKPDKNTTHPRDRVFKKKTLRSLNNK